MAMSEGEAAPEPEVTETEAEPQAETEPEAETEPDYNGRIGTVPGTKNYTYLTVGGQPPEMATLQVGETVYRTGQKVPLTDEQHDALVRDGHSFKEDTETK